MHFFFQEIKECQTSRTETDLSDIEKNLEEIAEWGERGQNAEPYSVEYLK